jgi:hypothetical protein
MSTHSITLTDVRQHARIALVLALLAIPGSTIAWELPGGGFWIGLPLAAAAIALGLRARAHSRSLAASGAIVLGCAEILFMATWIVVSLVPG